MIRSGNKQLGYLLHMLYDRTARNMKLLRLAAIVAVPAALSLAACSGGSSGVIGNNVGTGGQQANIRFVNGAPDLGSNVDIYFQATGAGAPSAPASSTTANVAYGVVTPFIQEAPTAAYDPRSRGGLELVERCARQSVVPAPAALEQLEVHRRDRRCRRR